MILIYAEKKIDKISYMFIIKILSDLRIDEYFLNLIKGIYKKFLQLTLYKMVKD